jgi:quinol monooxygenase YgiN
VAYLSYRRCSLPVHFFAQFVPPPEKATAFRQELMQVVEPIRAESGCLAIRAFESLREPPVFAIHSEWIDEAAFERHAQLSHTVRFIEGAKELLTHPVEGLRSREIAGGSGAAGS